MTERKIGFGGHLSGTASLFPDSSDEEVATVYNSLGAKKVSDYGARIKELMKEKPWE